MKLDKERRSAAPHFIIKDMPRHFVDCIDDV